MRSAIEQANSGAGIDTINFESAEGDMTITLSSPLPTLTDDNTTISTVKYNGEAGIVVAGERWRLV